MGCFKKLSVFLLLALTLVRAQLSSFSCAISTLTMKKGDPPFEVCNKLVSGGGFVSKQWVTGTFGSLGDGMEATLISMYIDGEATPSIVYWPFELSAIPSLTAWGVVHSAPQQQPWGSPLFSRNSATSFVNNIPVPFSSSVRITLTFTGNASAVLYYQAHGMSAPTFRFGDVDLPTASRLVIQRNALTLPRLAYLPIVNFTSNSKGLIAAMAIAFTAPNLNTLEGCFNLYDTATTAFPGELHSTGTEDEFISSYYFDQGPFQGRNAGVYYKKDVPAQISMWRS